MIGSHLEQLDRPVCDRKRKEGKRREKMHKMCTCIMYSTIMYYQILFKLPNQLQLHVHM